MVRPLGPVRLKKANPITLTVGVVLCIFIVYFLVASGGGSSAVAAARNVKAAAHPLSPPTLPFRKTVSRGKGGAGGAAASLPPPPVMRYNMNNVTTTANPIENDESILVLTPMTRFYQEYWDNLLRLSYPHELITLAFILPKTKEGNAATAALQAQVAKTQKAADAKVPFKSIIILRQDFEQPGMSQDEGERHKLANQKARRAALAKARNSLLFTTLGPSTSWVLWLDADIVESPPSLIQDLASHDKGVIAPNCFQRFFNAEKNQQDERPYDFNNWQDSPTAQELAQKLGPDDVLFEGYAEMATYRSLMAYMAVPGESVHTEVLLDGVGGTTLLVKAEVHRDGAMFPAFPFYHLIETEGFAKMAKRLSWPATGLPNYKVYHYNE